MSKKPKVPIILLENYQQYLKGQEIHVKPGFARNYLITQKIAVPSTPRYRDLYHIEHPEHFIKDQSMRKQRQKYRKRLDKVQLNIVRNVEGGKLSPGVVDEDIIAEKLEQQFFITIPRHKIELSKPIREPGDFNASIRLEDGPYTLKFKVSPRMDYETYQRGIGTGGK